MGGEEARAGGATAFLVDLDLAMVVEGRRIEVWGVVGGAVEVSFAQRKKVWERCMRLARRDGASRRNLQDWRT